MFVTYPMHSLHLQIRFLHDPTKDTGYVGCALSSKMLNIRCLHGEMDYLRESMNIYLHQPNPVTVRWEGVNHLRDPQFQRDAFRYRTSRLLQSVDARLNKSSKTLGGFGAWTRLLNHLLNMAESRMESVILAKFVELSR